MLARACSSAESVSLTERKMSLPAVLLAYTLSAEEQALANMLVECGQAHLFSKWDGSAAREPDVHRFFAQVAQLHTKYPGGLPAYVANARRLLRDSRDGVNPFEGYTPQVPAGERLEPFTPQFLEMEALGIATMKSAAFVLVAGGLGERLGYNGIKVALPVDLVSGKPYLQLYIEYLLAFQHRSQPGIVVPLCIMTSDDTHDATLRLLSDHSHFGMPSDHITIVKQEKVPSMVDNDAHFVLESDDLYALDTKPHGHGDVHSLLFLENVVQRWAALKKTHIVFFQDTNAAAFRAIPAALGVSVKRGFAVNSVAVPRRAGEAAGGIARLVHSSGKGDMTVNVEYNHLDPLLRATINPAGDVADSTGFSPFPGNVNVLVFALAPYHAALQATRGNVPEFVNPKYATAEKTTFSKPTRLECMLQDFPKLLDASASVGFTLFPRWIAFSAVKNNLADAAKKAASSLPPESASTGECEWYAQNSSILRQLGHQCTLADPTQRSFGGIPLSIGPLVHIAPSTLASCGEATSRFQNISLTARSSLFVEGDVTIRNLTLDGALVVRVGEGSSLVIDGLDISNAGWEFEALTAAELTDTAVSETLRMRGYRLKKGAAKELYIFNPGKSVLRNGVFSQS
eukprot:TRINITY_DN2317_c0_g1_i1.p1 TRINITY_DN2317_c0_g1~~TRINITY_DN2317_c0_g1_i1.p1  ORF type:complete len:628 (+),score=138.33 TRINITY_DN2317_c0_g1_i1:1800-3683(+)